MPKINPKDLDYYFNDEDYQDTWNKHKGKHNKPHKKKDVKNIHRKDKADEYFNNYYIDEYENM